MNPLSFVKSDVAVGIADVCAYPAKFAEITPSAILIVEPSTLTPPRTVVEAVGSVYAVGIVGLSVKSLYEVMIVGLFVRSL